MRPKVEISYQLFSLHFTSSMSIHFCKYHSKNSQTSSCLLLPVFWFCFSKCFDRMVLILKARELYMKVKCLIRGFMLESEAH